MMMKNDYENGFNDGREAIIAELLFHGFDSALIKSLLNFTDSEIMRIEETLICELQSSLAI